MTLPASHAVTVNGKTRSVASGMTVAALLDELETDPSCVVVEVNAAIVRRDHFAGCLLRDGDHVEVVRFVGGG